MSDEHDPTKPKKASSFESDEDREIAPGDIVKIGTDYSAHGVDTAFVLKQMREDKIDLTDTYYYLGTVPGDETTDFFDLAYIAKRDSPMLGEFIESMKQIHAPTSIDEEVRDQLFYVPHFVLEPAPIVKQ